MKNAKKRALLPPPHSWSAIKSFPEGADAIEEPDAKPRPVLMLPDDIRNLKRAADHARRSEDTIRRWCRRYGIARQSAPNAPLEISLLGLELVLYGDWEALELLRDGDRSHPAVQRYVKHLGLPG